MVQIEQLAARTPAVSVDELLNGFYPSPRFGEVSFASYRPDPAQPSQAARGPGAAALCGRRGRRDGDGLFKRLFGKKDTSRAGIYLDGGFGVGKTHLLASLWHAAPGPKAFGTFVEYTNLVGALSFRKTVEALSHYKLVCIDEFELDDPGDTVLMSRLMRELADAGVKLAATSNTLPGSLGRRPLCRRRLRSAKSRCWRTSSTSSGSTARTSATAACRPRRRRCATMT